MEWNNVSFKKIEDSLDSFSWWSLHSIPSLLSVSNSISFQIFYRMENFTLDDMQVFLFEHIHNWNKQPATIPVTNKPIEHPVLSSSLFLHWSKVAKVSAITKLPPSRKVNATTLSRVTRAQYRISLDSMFSFFCFLMYFWWQEKSDSGLLLTILHWSKQCLWTYFILPLHLQGTIRFCLVSSSMHILQVWVELFNSAISFVGSPLSRGTTDCSHRSETNVDGGHVRNKPWHKSQTDIQH